MRCNTSLEETWPVVISNLLLCFRNCKTVVIGQPLSTSECGLFETRMSLEFYFENAFSTETMENGTEINTRIKTETGF